MTDGASQPRNYPIRHALSFVSTKKHDRFQTLYLANDGTLADPTKCAFF